MECWDQIKSELTQIAVRLESRPANDRKRWTNAILRAICSVGNAQKYSVYAHGAANFSTPEIHAGGEWLFDCTWIKYESDSETKRLRRLVLAAECEFDPLDKVADDFEKLIVANADIKLTIFIAPNEKQATEDVQYLMRHAHACEQGSLGKYRFAVFVTDENQFRFFVE